MVNNRSTPIVITMIIAIAMNSFSNILFIYMFSDRNQPGTV
jgi:hypothetical protein